MKALALPVEQARQAIGLGRTKFYHLVNEGKIPARKIGRRTVVLTEDLERFVRDLAPVHEAGVK